MITNEIWRNVWWYIRQLATQAQNIKDGAQPYHTKPFPILKTQKTLKSEINGQINIGVLKLKNKSKRAAPTFIIPKNNGTVHFISDFRDFNEWIKRKPFPISKLQDLTRFVI